MTKRGSSVECISLSTWVRPNNENRASLEGKELRAVNKQLLNNAIPCAAIHHANCQRKLRKIVWKSLTRTLSIWLEIWGTYWPTLQHTKNSKLSLWSKTNVPDDYFGENLWRTVPDMKENRWRSLSIMDLHLTKRGSFQSTASSVNSASTSRPQSEVPLTNNGQSYELIKSTQVSNLDLIL